MRRTSEQWLALFDQLKSSGLTQTEFANQQGIDPSYFSLRKRQLLAWQQDDNDGFVELTPHGIVFCQPMLLKKRDIELHLAAGTDAVWLATLLKAMS
ncbi:IS66 family insertion sequence element accessory protein TnpB [Vibrio fluvialis]|nr:IS66 family insertion sequence element accessory protein TnpB [Vibrio fluvialis]MBL4267013.1 IS66 family insertion sequence element accessory protein TnpB [Vibrio fluvialis]MBL4271198.1 IS66 family insertion sequence element accessory protein TnpB [Vibrio fluvialis]MBL4275572.1 IS66 family insertion sequence element accessory protein TnpB [Vibrio fluvialis]MBO1442626.1 IS66 family insertion sequence element accessory protein TnpB [Vibrio fluvialis]